MCIDAEGCYLVRQRRMEGGLSVEGDRELRAEYMCEGKWVGDKKGIGC